MLKLATDPPIHEPMPLRSSCGPYRIDRRQNVRQAAAGRALAVRASREPAVFLGQLMPLELKDISPGGLAAVCDDRLGLHESLTIYMPGERKRPGHTLHGHVVRCRSLSRQSQGRGCYQIAVVFDPDDAA